MSQPAPIASTVPTTSTSTTSTTTAATPEAPKGLHERKIALWVARGLSYLVYAYLIVVEIILLLGFLLLLFGANPSAGFTQWAYRNLDRVMAPFRGIFTPIHLGTTSGDVEAVFDTSVIFAMIVYGIIALAMAALINWLSLRLARIEDTETEIQRRAEADEAARQYAERQWQAHVESEARAQALVELAKQQAAAPATPTQPPPPPAQPGV